MQKQCNEARNILDDFKPQSDDEENMLSLYRQLVNIIDKPDLAEYSSSINAKCCNVTLRYESLVEAHIFRVALVLEPFDQSVLFAFALFKGVICRAHFDALCLFRRSYDADRSNTLVKTV